MARPIHRLVSRLWEEMPSGVGYRMTQAATRSRIIAAKTPLTPYPQRREYGQMGNDARNGRISDRIAISIGDMGKPAVRSKQTLAIYFLYRAQLALRLDGFQIPGQNGRDPFARSTIPEWRRYSAPDLAGQDALHFPIKPARISSDESIRSPGYGNGPLRVLAHRQARNLEERRFFLNATGIGDNDGRVFL